MLSRELCLYDTRELVYRQSDEWIIHLPNISLFMIIILKPLSKIMAGFQLGLLPVLTFLS